ncbi:MAG: PASTA domain-containing protein [Gemmatimonadaceae bacterium]
MVIDRARLRTAALYAGVALAGWLSAYLLVALLLLPGDGRADGVNAPSVVGLSLEQARAALDSAGLRFALGDERPSADVPRNTVMAQSPLPGTSLQRLAAVTLDVSSGPRRVRIPPLEGLTVEAARNLLATSGLALGASREESNNEPRGEVLRSDPDAGRFVGEGAAITLVVSSGPSSLAMPDLVGRDPADAVILLNQLGLTNVQIENDSTAGSALNLVFAQRPAAGAAVRAGDRIVLRVASRP